MRVAGALMETPPTSAAVDNLHQNARNELATVQIAFAVMPHQLGPLRFHVALTQRAATQAGSHEHTPEARQGE